MDDPDTKFHKKQQRFQSLNNNFSLLKHDTWYRVVMIVLSVTVGISFTLLAYSLITGDQKILSLEEILTPMMMTVMGVLLGIHHGFKVGQKKVNSTSS